MQSILVGEDVNGCAFVYGSLSFLDKISCGLALYVLESYQSEQLTYYIFLATIFQFRCELLYNAKCDLYFSTIILDDKWMKPTSFVQLLYFGYMNDKSI